MAEAARKKVKRRNRGNNYDVQRREFDAAYSHRLIRIPVAVHNTAILLRKKDDVKGGHTSPPNLQQRRPMQRDLAPTNFVQLRFASADDGAEFWGTNLYH